MVAKLETASDGATVLLAAITELANNKQMKEPVWFPKELGGGTAIQAIADVAIELGADEDDVTAALEAAPDGRDPNSWIVVFTAFLVALWIGILVVVAARAFSYPRPIHLWDTYEFKLIELDRKRYAEKCGNLARELEHEKERNRVLTERLGLII